ncbi:hypothetical protein ACIQW5_11340 [Methylorubrum thiocyanatum]|uniref:hypothetical protein n=1 Tax=Methylorubrum thiocyanatum TaxID=47958 RepID=UPI00383A0E52
MGTILRLKIANGHRPQIGSYSEAHPGISPFAAVRLWVVERYGGWIERELATDQFEILLAPCGEQFDIRFTFEDHATRFLAEVGGQIVREAV